MNKSILVIDTPKSCMDCEIFDHEQLRYLGCKVNFGELSKVQSWCPLRDLPKRKNSLVVADGDGIRFEEPTEFEQGYNACIDEILGN